MNILRFASGAIGALLLVSAAGAQTAPPVAAAVSAPSANGEGAAAGSTSPADAQTPPAVQPHEDKRAYGVLPNYRTAEADVPFAPITSHQKLMIGVKDSFDGTAYPLAAFFSATAQVADTNPSYGQGVRGYAKRFGSAFADQVLGNMFTEAMLPIALHEDPRFFRKGSGKFWNRVGYAATRVLICKTDTGANTFNVPEILGNGVVASIGNLYYPDERGFSSTMTRMVTQVGTDAFSNVLKEFWPDVKRHYARKHREKLERQQKTPIATDE